MQPTPSHYYSPRVVIRQIGLFAGFLFRRPLALIAVALIMAALATGYWYIQKPKYEAISTFILEEKSPMGGLAGLASQFGFNLGGMTGGNLFAGDNILSILTSKAVVEEVLLSKVTDNDSVRLADLYLDFAGKHKKWAKKPHLLGISFKDAAKGVTPLQDSVLHVVYDELVKKPLSTERLSKQGSIIRVTLKSENSQFARLMVDRIVTSASKLYFDIKTGVAEANIAKMQKTSDSLLYLLNRRTYSAAASQQVDLNPALKLANVPVEIAMRDKTVLATLYAEVTKNLEASKLMLSQQTPVIQVLDRPGLLLDDHKKTLPLLIVVFVFAGMAIYAAVKLLVYLQMVK